MTLKGEPVLTDSQELGYLQELRDRIKAGEQGDDIACIMSIEFGVDYDAACEAIISGNTAEALALLESAIQSRIKVDRTELRRDSVVDTSDCRYVVEVHCTGMGFVESKYGADTPVGAKVAESMLLNDASAWVNPAAPKETRIWDREQNAVLA